MEGEFDYKKYCSSISLFSFEVGEFKFTCEEMLSGEEIEFFNYYIENDGTTNIARLRMTQATKIKDSPFSKEWIRYIFDTFYPDIKLEEGITWSTMSLKLRLLFLERLEKELISGIMTELTKYYTNKINEVKN